MYKEVLLILGIIYLGIVIGFSLYFFINLSIIKRKSRGVLVFSHYFKISMLMLFLSFVMAIMNLFEPTIMTFVFIALAFLSIRFTNFVAVYKDSIKTFTKRIYFSSIKEIVLSQYNGFIKLCIIYDEGRPIQIFFKEKKNVRKIVDGLKDSDVKFRADI